MINIDWSKFGCGVHQAPFEIIMDYMPALVQAGIWNDFPENLSKFTWDIKIHMLMPRQYPCIPNWHADNVPRVAGRQQFDKIKPEYPMYLWLSNGPLTEFEDGYVMPQKWVRFTQKDNHRGTAASEFGWRCFIRGTHVEIMQPKKVKHESEYIRRHCQVYVSEDYKW